jgi:hypothetical protein
MGKNNPSPEQKKQMLEAQMERIAAALKSGKPYSAIAQFGDNLTPEQHGKPVMSLDIFRRATSLDGPHSDTIARRVKELYDQAQKATQEYIAVQGTGTGDQIHCIPVKSIQFTAIFRTPETRRLDTKYAFQLNFTGMNLRTNLLASTETHTGTSNLMALFEHIANQTRYFAGVQVSELKPLIKGPGLETHVKEGFVALKQYSGPDGKKGQIAVPVRFY